MKTVLENKLPSLNDAVASFWAEIKAQGLANSVTVVQGSEFGRTITPNSNEGSDHAWGGNYFMFGGDVKGGKILGEYPKSFSESDPTNIGRGRLIPTTSWDALFYGLTQWMGISDQDEIEVRKPTCYRLLFVTISSDRLFPFLSIIAVCSPKFREFWLQSVYRL